MLYDWAVPIWPWHRWDNDPKLQKVYKDAPQCPTVGPGGRVVASLWQQVSASASELAPPQGTELGPQQLFGSFLHFSTLILFQ